MVMLIIHLPGEQAYYCNNSRLVHHLNKPFFFTQSSIYKNRNTKRSIVSEIDMSPFETEQTVDFIKRIFAENLKFNLHLQKLMPL